MQKRGQSAHSPWLLLLALGVKDQIYRDTVKAADPRGLQREKHRAAEQWMLRVTPVQATAVCSGDNVLSDAILGRGLRAAVDWLHLRTAGDWVRDNCPGSGSYDQTSRRYPECHR